MRGPIPQSYWVDEHLAAGVHPAAFGFAPQLTAAGIDTFVDLTGRHPYEAADLRHFPVPDMGVPDDVDEILDAIDEARASGRTVYVHCWAGRGRTGTVIGCWLARHGSTDPLGDLDRLRTHLDTTSPETAAQRRFVEAYRP